MRLAWVVVIAGACGRVGFDPLGPLADGAPPDVGYFVSPAGSDSNPGTRAQPWGTLAYAVSRLQPGDQLNLLDGDYDGKAPVGSFLIDCTTNAVNGTAAAPIVVRADHPRRAHVFDVSSPLHVENCAYWTFEDLWIEGLDDPNDSGSVARLYMGDHLVARGLLGQHPNRYFNLNVIEAGFSTNTLVENCEAYDFHRSAFVSYQSTATTFRNLYANGRGYPDLAGGYTSACPGGDNGVEDYYDRGGAIENVVIEGACDTGFSVVAGSAAMGSTGIGDSHHVDNAIALGHGTLGVWLISDCNANMPCDTPDRIASQNVFTNVVAIDYDVGFEIDGVENLLDHVSAFATASGEIVVLEVETPLDTLAASATVTAALGVGGTSGITSINQTAWSVDHANVFNNTSPYVPLDANVTASTTIDPALGGCEVYIPPASPMATAGPSGTTIGADIRTLSQDGTPTTTPFWAADGTFAACGPTVPGINDDPSTACTGVHQRLNVGAGGCALP